MTKKIIIGIIALFLVSGIITTIILYPIYKRQSDNINTDTSKVGSINVNGQNYKTTGSIPHEDVSARNLSDQIIKLASRGEIDGNGFKILDNNGEKVQITLYEPYDQNKQSALKWLQDNGFDMITESDIVFTNQP